jgi:hypothetical protein
MFPFFKGQVVLIGPCLICLCVRESFCPKSDQKFIENNIPILSKNRPTWSPTKYVFLPNGIADQISNFLIKNVASCTVQVQNSVEVLF